MLFGKETDSRIISVCYSLVGGEVEVIITFIVVIITIVLVDFVVEFYNFSQVLVLYKMAEYVQILDSWNRKLCNNKVCTEKEEGGKVDILVSVAQVLSALELALIIGGDSRDGGCSDDSS